MNLYDKALYPLLYVTLLLSSAVRWAVHESPGYAFLTGALLALGVAFAVFAFVVRSAEKEA